MNAGVHKNKFNACILLQLRKVVKVKIDLHRLKSSNNTLKVVYRVSIMTVVLICLYLIPNACTEDGSLDVPDKIIQKQPSDATNEG